MTKLDSKHEGIIRNVKDGVILSSSQWVAFTIDDNIFATILPMYYQECIRQGCSAEQVTSVVQLITDVDAWRHNNLDKCKNPEV